MKTNPRYCGIKEMHYLAYKYDFLSTHSPPAIFKKLTNNHDFYHQHRYELNNDIKLGTAAAANYIRGEVSLTSSAVKEKRYWLIWDQLWNPYLTQAVSLLFQYNTIFSFMITFNFFIFINKTPSTSSLLLLYFVTYFCLYLSYSIAAS